MNSTNHIWDFWYIFFWLNSFFDMLSICSVVADLFEPKTGCRSLTSLGNYAQFVLSSSRCIVLAL